MRKTVGITCDLSVFASITGHTAKQDRTALSETPSGMFRPGELRGRPEISRQQIALEHDEHAMTPILAPHCTDPRGSPWSANRRNLLHRAVDKERKPKYRHE